MMVKCLTPGCKNRKEMARPGKYRCFDCKSKTKRAKSKAHWRKTHDLPAQKV